MILTLIVGNGDWWRPRVDVGLGVYVLEAATSGGGVRRIPDRVRRRADVRGYRVEARWADVRFSSRGGTPGTLGVPGPFLQGVLAGLTPGTRATIAVSSVPCVEGHCYAEGAPPGCSPSPGPEPLVDMRRFCPAPG